MSLKPIKRIAVTGAAGQIAYNLLFRIASGEMLGSDQPISLHLVELPIAMQAVEGVRMELEDCAFPLLKEIQTGSNPVEMFRDIDYALLIGSKPRGPGMERKDLLNDNGKIFIEQGRALNEAASSDVKVLVVGNPCNTNCLIAMAHAPRISRKNFHAMTRLDQNRAAASLAQKAGVDISVVSNVTIWGNHSSTQVPDFINASINGKPVLEIIRDEKWLEGPFFEAVQKRGAAIIAARGKSSAASAAQGAIESIKELVTPTPQNKWFSSAVYSEGNPYGIDQNLVFSFPCRSSGNGNWTIVPNLKMSDFLKAKIRLTEKELIEERELVRDLLKGD